MSCTHCGPLAFQFLNRSRHHLLSSEAHCSQRKGHRTVREDTQCRIRCLRHAPPCVASSAHLASPPVLALSSLLQPRLSPREPAPRLVRFGLLLASIPPVCAGRLPLPNAPRRLPAFTSRQHLGFGTRLAGRSVHRAAGSSWWGW